MILNDGIAAARVARLLPFALAAAAWHACSCGPAPSAPTTFVLESNGADVVVETQPFSIALPRTRTTASGGCAPLFVDVRPIGDSGGFVKPEDAPVGLVRFRSQDATLVKEAPLTLDVVLQADGEDDRSVRVELRKGAEGFLSIEARFDVDERDVGFVGTCFALAPEEHAVGGGERFDAVDLRGRTVPLYFAAPRPSASGTNEAHAPVPFVATTHGLGVFVDTERVGAFDVGASAADALELRFHGTALPLFVRDGEIVDNVAAYARLAGLPKPPARFALAPMQWRNALEPAVDAGVVVRSGTDMLLDDVEQMRARGFPASTVWIDAPWETGYNTFVENETQLPNLDAALETLRARGLVAMVWATEHLNTSDDHEQMIGMPDFGSRALAQQFEQDGFLVTTESGDPFEFPWGRGRGTFVDFTNPDACLAYRALMAPLVTRGIVGMKLDYGESMRPDLLGLENDVPRFSDGSTTRTMHTAYARLYHECFAAELRAQHSDEWFIITRTGGVGDQRNGTAIWPGDLDTSFVPGGIESDDGLTVGGLPAAVFGMLSLAMSGYPLYGSDVGGYRDGPPSPELFLRWAQFGALSTVMQVGGGANFAPWDAGYEEVVDDIVGTARLHMQLWPSFEAWLGAASEAGTPVVVPVGVLSGEDADAWADAYSFVVGDTLLVAPVVVDGARERELFVPPGRWRELVLDDAGALAVGAEVLEGPGRTTVAAPLSRTVVFAREGAALLVGDARLMTMLPTDDEADGGFNFFGDTHTLAIEAP